MSWVKLPGDWWRDRRIAALDPTAQALLVRMLCWSADYDSDGRLTDAQVAIVEPPIKRRKSALTRLEATGLIERRRDGWSIVGWDEYLRAAIQVDERREQNTAAGHLGGIARADTARRIHGRFAPKDPGESPGRSPGSDPGPLPPTPGQGEETVSGSIESDGPREAADDPADPGDGGEAVRRTPPSPPTEGPDDPGIVVGVLARGKGRPKGTDSGNRTAEPTRRTRPVPAWGEGEWTDAVEAWEGRGLHEPKSPAQRRVLWRIVQAFPDQVGGWIGEAPYDERGAYGVVAYVLDRAAEARQMRRFEELAAEEQVAWMRIERTLGPGAANPARKMRTEGTDLPEALGGENPYRLALGVLAQRLEDDPPLKLPGLPRDELDEMDF